jgi:hypothetical protein
VLAEKGVLPAKPSVSIFEASNQNSDSCLENESVKVRNREWYSRISQDYVMRQKLMCC